MSVPEQPAPEPGADRYPRSDAVSIDVRVEREMVRLSVSGVIDDAASLTLQVRADEAFGSGCHHLVIDLSHVTAVDVSGLRVLLSIRARARQIHARLEITTEQSEVALLLHRCGIDAVLVPSRERKSSPTGA